MKTYTFISLKEYPCKTKKTDLIYSSPIKATRTMTIVIKLFMSPNAKALSFTARRYQTRATLLIALKYVLTL